MARFRPQMIGTNLETIQTDEAWFAGKQKYRRGRKQYGEDSPQSEDSDAEVENQKNHGHRVLTDHRYLN